MTYFFNKLLLKHRLKLQRTARTHTRPFILLYQCILYALYLCLLSFFQISNTQGFGRQLIVRLSLPFLQYYCSFIIICYFVLLFVSDKELKKETLLDPTRELTYATEVVNTHTCNIERWLLLKYIKKGLAIKLDSTS